MITTLRRYFAYSIIDSTKYEVSLELTIKVNNEEYIILPIKNYTGELRITDSKNNEMIILSDREFEKRFGVPMSVMTDVYISDLRVAMDNKNIGLTDENRVIAILLSDKKEEYYEKIKVSWIERFSLQQVNRLQFGSVRVPIYIAQYGNGEPSGLYLSVKSNSKYIILNEPEFKEINSSEMVKVITIHYDEHTRIYRFEDDKKAKFIQIIVEIGLPNSIKRYAYLGAIAGLIIPIFVAALTITNGKIPHFSYELLIAVTGLLIGQRIFVFEDLSFIEYWNKIHMILGIICIVLLIILIGAEWEGIVSVVGDEIDTCLNNQNSCTDKSSQVVKSIKEFVEMNDTIIIDNFFNSSDK